MRGRTLYLNLLRMSPIRRQFQLAGRQAGTVTHQQTKNMESSIDHCDCNIGYYVELNVFYECLIEYLFQKTKTRGKFSS